MKERPRPESEPSPQSRLRTIAALATLALLLALTAIACAKQDAKIAFISDRDGSGLVQLTDNTSRDFAPHLYAAP